MVVALLYAMQSPCNCFTLSLSGSDSRSNNSWRDDNDATMECGIYFCRAGRYPGVHNLLQIIRRRNPPCNAEDNMRAGLVVIETWFRGY